MKPRQVEPIDPKMVLCADDAPSDLHEPTVKALMVSMGKLGLLEPILVWRPTGGGYCILISGRHRLEAARRLKWDDIHAVVHEGSDLLHQELVQARGTAKPSKPVAKTIARSTPVDLFEAMRRLDLELAEWFDAAVWAAELPDWHRGQLATAVDELRAKLFRLGEALRGRDAPTDGRPPETLYCSFCGKSQHEARKLIAGPNVFICNECVDLCASIMG